MRWTYRLLMLALVACSPVLLSYADSTWTGYVTDTHCGTNCQRTSDMKPDLKCIQLCVRKGSKYGLWSGNHVYVLEPQWQAASFAAQNVEVNGTIRNDTIHITSIKAVAVGK
ncbi:MAG: hypothetical protein ACR2JB_11725 [Bryobacteraceae bacterium]